MDGVVSAESILFESFRLDRHGGCLFDWIKGVPLLPAEAKAALIHLFSMKGRLGLFSKVVTRRQKSPESQARQQVRG